MVKLSHQRWKVLVLSCIIFYGKYICRAVFRAVPFKSIGGEGEEHTFFKEHHTMYKKFDITPRTTIITRTR